MGSRSHFRDHATDKKGNVLPGATINVYQQGTTTPIVEDILQFDSDHALSADTLANPFIAGDEGQIDFYLADPQRCDLKITSGGRSRTITIDVNRTPNDGFSTAVHDTHDHSIALGSASIEDLSDVDLSGIAAGSLLYYDGANIVDLGVGTTGQVLKVNAGATAPEWDDPAAVDVLRMYKAADETVPLDDTFHDDADLFFPVEPGEVWAFQMGLFVSGLNNAASADITFKFVCTDGTGRWGLVSEENGDARAINTEYAFFGPHPASQSVFHVDGLVTNTGATTQNCRFQWKMRFSATASPSIQQNTFLIATKVA